jgi:hypothetical protein
MKRFLLAAALCVLTLSGCDTLRGFFGMPTNENPVVSVTNNQISVSPDPLMFTRPGSVQITWTLDPSAVAAGFRFAGPGRGIRIEGEKINDRPVDTPESRGQFERQDLPGPAGDRYRLQFKNNRKGLHEYKYTIILTGPNGEISKDPAIINDW